MKKSIVIWLIIIFLPVILWSIVVAFGLNGLYGYALYYFPLWVLGKPFFTTVSVEIRVYIPTWYGIVTAAIIYSAIYWLVYFIFQWGKKISFRNEE